MKKIETSLKDCYILEPQRFGDERGYFESITELQLKELGFNRIFQISNSLSGKGIVRGLHFQYNPYCQAKVVRCHRGAVLDVVVDLRRDSETYREWTSVELSPENGRLLYVPRGFAHGFVSLKDDTLFEYYVDNIYMPKMEGGILWNDPEININWDKIFKKYNIKEPILSDKDKNREGLSEWMGNFYRIPKFYLLIGMEEKIVNIIRNELNERGEYNVIDKHNIELFDIDTMKNVIKEYNPNIIFNCKKGITDEVIVEINGADKIMSDTVDIKTKILSISYNNDINIELLSSLSKPLVELSYLDEDGIYSINNSEYVKIK